jgi:hypothetical protein
MRVRLARALIDRRQASRALSLVDEALTHITRSLGAAHPKVLHST